MDYRTLFALKLQGLSFDADFVLDLHTGDLAPHYLYAPEYAWKSAPYFHIPHILLMQNQFAGAFDEVNFCAWWTLVEELKALGRTDIHPDVEAYTVELGSLEIIRPEEMERDADRILNFLRHKGMVSGEAKPPAETLYACHIQDYLSYCAPASGLAVIDLAPGAHLKAGQQLGYILTMRNYRSMDHPEQALTPVLVREDGILITRSRSPIVFEGQVLFKCMTRFSSLEVST
jgi:predicted deacylase